MPALKNPKFERVAQLMAKGKKPSEAYAEVHPKAKYPERNVGRFLKMHPEIEARVTEIVNTKVDTEAFVVTKAMEQAVVDKAYVLTNLKEIVERCMQSKPVLDMLGRQVYVETKDGQVAAAYGFDPKPAVAALKLLGQEVGMFVTRVRVERGPFDGMPASEVEMIQKALAELQGGRVFENEPSAAPPVAIGAPA